MSLKISYNIRCLKLYTAPFPGEHRVPGGSPPGSPAPQPLCPRAHSGQAETAQWKPTKSAPKISPQSQVREIFYLT